jgi:alkanesulfonate monooxygenase SsuD/methylene tetrahydromethanopterin reductase-like flavin-dependent oxidoreductase (luciferase family)
MPPLRFGVAYDFRNPPGSGLTNADLYARVLAQAERVDRLGFELIWLTEHHFVEDGYLPSFVPVAGALVSTTSRAGASSWGSEWATRRTSSPRSASIAERAPR